MTLMLLIFIIGVLQSQVHGHDADLFCVDYPPIARLFRLANQLYLELQASPGHYIVFNLENSTFAPNLVRFEQLMTEDNQHVFTSIISASTLEDDREYLAELVAASEDIGMDYDLSTATTSALNGKFSTVRHQNRTAAGDLKAKAHKRTKRKPLGRLHSRKKKITKPTTTSTSTSSPVTAARLNRKVPVRIWGQMDTGAFPLEQLYPSLGPFPQVGYEDFFFYPANNSLEYRDEFDYGDDYWPARRTQFPFDCFIFLPEHGPVAVIHNEYREQIVRYQLNKPRSLTWRQEPFDVQLRVFYSETKFDSCVELNNVVALLSEENRLTLVYRSELVKSFWGTSSEVLASLETTLYELLCIKQTGLLEELDRMMLQANLKANQAAPPGRGKVIFSKASSTGKWPVSPKGGSRDGGGNSSPRWGSWLRSYFSVKLAAVCVIFLSLAGVGCVLVYGRDELAAIRGTAASGQAINQAPKVAANRPKAKATINAKRLI